MVEVAPRRTPGDCRMLEQEAGAHIGWKIVGGPGPFVDGTPCLAGAHVRWYRTKMGQEAERTGSGAQHEVVEERASHNCDTLGAGAEVESGSSAASTEAVEAAYWAVASA
jgi:hypothetical protein